MPQSVKYASLLAVLHFCTRMIGGDTDGPGTPCANTDWSCRASAEPSLDFMYPLAADNQALVDGSLLISVRLRGGTAGLRLDPGRLVIQVGQVFQRLAFPVLCATIGRTSEAH